ncbi:TPA: MFS transporter [Morganella morganii]|uniref:MFS transporter n=1 Tax=Morganella morganii TaxID=582 RepID=UPI00092233CB|nr:MFS transporter [Morganella morganii]SGC47318.1 arabinose efflux permease family protein [Mycobacterium tuberculosis]ELA7726527.1 MFS transporter [Morganella morganii]MBA5837874.1 MFS transporter [Morganella morganii]MBC3997763.1 MFS transporter [Morganella morganii]MBT0311852.1 MFS transporter [Morganella morganii subsp. morganii]
MRTNTALLSLSVGAFAIGATEFSPMGMLPEIAGSLAVSIPAAGMLVVVYALGVMLGAPVMTLLLIRRSPKAALIFLMSIFTAGNVLSALAPDYNTLLFARFITSLNHGAFFGIGAMVATRVVAKGKEAGAIAGMFMGLTIANIGGVPAITKLSQVLGWRESFFVASLLGLLTMAALLRSLPRNMQGQELNLRRELQVLTRPAVLLAMLCTVLGASAMFTFYTYIAPALTFISSVPETQISIMLVLVGLGFTLGNYLGGVWANRSVSRTLYGLFALLALTMVLFPLVARDTVTAGIMLVIWGAASFGIVPPLQVKVMQVASEAQALASSVNIGAFNLGNAVGAALGASVLANGGDYAGVSYAGAAVAAAGLVVLRITLRRTKSQKPVSDAEQCTTI